MFIFIATQPVMATTYNATNPEYISSDIPDITVAQDDYMLADTSNSATTFNGVLLSWRIQDGDQLYVDLYDSSGSFTQTITIDTSNLSMDNVSHSIVSNAAKLRMVTSSASGYRYFWWSEVENSVGNTMIFPDPDTSLYSTGGSSNDDYSSIIDAISDQTQALSTELSNITSQINGLTSQMTGVSNQLSTAISSLDSLNSKADGINNKLDTIEDYLTTPQSSSISINLGSTPTFNSTPPTIQDSGSTPYTYDRSIPQMPTFVDSPDPLPTIPKPIIIEHADPIVANEPETLNTPIEQQESGSIETPTSREEPITQQTVNIDNPIQIDEPISMTGYSQENPLTPQEPLEPQQPLQSNP